MDINRVTICGNLTKDVVAKTSAKGNPYCQFSVATNNTRYNQQTRAWESTGCDFHNCMMNGKGVEKFAQNALKGTRVIVFGKITYNQDEQKRYWTTIVVEEAYVVGANEVVPRVVSGDIPQQGGANLYPAPQMQGSDEGVPF